MKPGGCVWSLGPDAHIQSPRLTFRAVGPGGARSPLGRGVSLVTRTGHHGAHLMASFGASVDTLSKML